MLLLGVVQKKRGPPFDDTQSVSEVQPTAAHTPSAPHTVPLKGCPVMSPDGLQSWSTEHGMTHDPALHAARAFPRREKHSPSFAHGAGTHRLFVRSHA